MNNKYIMQTNEIMLWISIIILSILAFIFDPKYNIIIMFWSLSIILIGNAKRLYSDKHYKMITFIRRIIYFLPLTFPLFIGVSPRLKSDNLVQWVFIGVILGLLFIAPKITEWRIVLSKDIIMETKPITGIECSTQVLMLVGAAVCEEFFFRAFIIGYIDNSMYFLSVVLSSFLFFLYHYGSKWSEQFRLVDFIIQILFGLLSALLFLVSKSLIPCIMAHLTYNFPLIILSVKKYVYHKKTYLQM